MVHSADIASQMSGSVLLARPHRGGMEGTPLDGTEIDNEITYLRFGKDLRLKEVQKLLTSARLVSMKNTQLGSDHDLVAAQQSHLLQLCKRTLSISVGRGMFTLSTLLAPLLTEAIQIPPILLNGKIAGTKSSVALDLTASPADFLHWPEFNNGVAAGLRVSDTVRR